jgi:hypothetical protein
MKNLFHILFFFLLFLITAFPQDRNQGGVIPERLTAERLLEIQKSNAGGLQGFNYKEFLLLKSKRSNCRTALRNPQREFYEEGFNAKDSRTTINKTMLGNGYLLIETIFQSWNGSAWVNTDKNSFTYDGNNNLTELLYQSWDGSTWVNYSKQSYTYDGNNNLSERLDQYWDGSAWVSIYKNSYTYDGNNNRTEAIWQTWDGSAWVNSYKYSYTYNENNILIESLGQSWDGSVWVNSGKSLYSYDGNNNLIELLSQTWDGFDWVDAYKQSYTFDVNNNLIEELDQIWSSSEWTNNYKYSYTYDVNNNLTEALWQTWDFSNWVNDYKLFYTYDGNNNLAERIQQRWDGSAWVDNIKGIYSYILTGIEQYEGEVSSYSLSNNYPNPFNPSTKIRYSVPQSSDVIIKVFDILGNEIETLVNEEKPAGTYEITWYAANLPSGVYFYRLKSEGYVETKKMILLK